MHCMYLFIGISFSSYSGDIFAPFFAVVKRSHIIQFTEKDDAHLFHRLFRIQTIYPHSHL
jgi:hypothetical protein